MANAKPAPPAASRWVLLLYLLPLLLAIAVRLTFATYFEYESQEDTVRAAAIIEHANLPLYGIGHVRFLGAALGPLVYYLKAIPHLFTAHPGGEVVFLFILHLMALTFSMFLARDMARSIFQAPRDSWLPHGVALGTGVLLALSVHSNAITSHAHPSYFAGALMPVVVFGIHRHLALDDNRWLVPAGIAFGLMTQLYQLTLFSPFMLAAMFVVARRKPSVAAARRFLIPVVICYVPYLVSELVTGFWNTLNFFTYQPGPNDASMVGAPAFDNLAFLVTTSVDYRFLSNLLDGIFLIGGAAGIVVVFRHALRSVSARILAVFGLFYLLLPAVILGAPRFQLSLPATHLIVTLGLTALVVAAHRTIGRGNTRATAATAAAVLAMVAGSYFFGRSEADAALRRHLYYPLRIVFTEPAGRTPDLSRSVALLEELRGKHGVNLENLSRAVYSPIVGSGYYGHHYLMRYLESTLPSATADTSPRLLVFDDYFPFDVYSPGTSHLGDTVIASLSPPRVLDESFELTVRCDHPWCAERAEPARAAPAITFFWGCGEFRDLADQLSVPPEECEQLLTAPEHRREYNGVLQLPGQPSQCPDCTEIIYLGATLECSVEVTLDEQPLQPLWVEVRERKFGFYVVPPDLATPGSHRLAIALDGCVPLYFELAGFAGRPRQEQAAHDEFWSKPRSDPF